VTAAAFADVSQHDYHLPFDSPAVDNGTTIAEVIQDRDGVPRPVGDGYDIGAYESVPGTLIFADGFESGDLSAWATTELWVR
jgi:hypothetical protein